MIKDDIESAIRIRSRALIDASESLGSSKWASLARACSIPLLFEGMESVFAANENPIDGINGLIDRLTKFFESATASGIHNIGCAAENRQAKTADDSLPVSVETITGQHYGRLFGAFSRPSFWSEPAELLRVRLDRNGIDILDLPQWDVLDAGCGGGRYTVAWRLLGARQVVGLDISSIGIADARNRIEEAGIVGISFHEGSVLDMPFPDNNFDIVFSNGVLHHATDWKKGISEMLRVGKPGGLCWLYLIEKPGGLFWSLIEVMRELMKDEEREYARVALKMLGIPDNRIFYMLDHVMAPINLRLTSAEIEECLSEAGAIQIRRLTRGADFDRIERIYQKEPYAEIKFGVGENRYVFTKGQ